MLSSLLFWGDDVASSVAALDFRVGNVREADDERCRLLAVAMIGYF